jgi:hypothetical protein
VNSWGILNVVILIWICNQLLGWVTKPHSQDEGKSKSIQIEIKPNNGQKINNVFELFFPY